MRQYLIRAALKRADELNRLRDLPDTPLRAKEAPPKVAGLPSDRTDADPEETATIPETPVVTIPIEIGEPSSVELPAVAPQALPQSSPQDESSSVKKAEQAKPRPDARRRVYRARPHTRVAAKPTQSRQYNFLEMFFWTAGSTIDVQRPGAERQPNLTAAGLRVAIPATRVWQPAAVLSVACDEQRADDPAHILCGPSLNSLLGHRPISKSRASYRNSRTNRSHRFACWPHADFAAN